MNATEAAALRTLAQREEWPVGDLPASIEAEMLMRLDERGLVLARTEDAQASDGEANSTHGSGWHSPSVHGLGVGSWKSIRSGLTQTGQPMRAWVKASARGAQELARLDDWPPIALQASLAALSGLSDNAMNFHQLGRNRRLASEAWQKYLARLNSADPQRATKLRAEQRWVQKQLGSPSLKLILTNAHAWIARAKAALVGGGAKRLCDAEGTRTFEIDARVKLNHAQSIVFTLDLSLSDAVLFEDYALELRDFGRWCRGASERLRALLELEGTKIHRNIPGWDEILPMLAPGWYVSMGPLAESMPPAADNGLAILPRGRESGGRGRGNNAEHTYPTVRDLCSEAGISDDTFRRVRDAAAIEVKLKGAAARNRRYSPEEVDRLICAALAGNFLERSSMAKKWARWGSEKAASKPHASK